MYFEFDKSVNQACSDANKTGPQPYLSEASNLGASNLTKSSFAIAAPANPMKPISTYTSVMVFLLSLI